MHFSLRTLLKNNKKKSVLFYRFPAYNVKNNFNFTDFYLRILLK